MLDVLSSSLKCSNETEKKMKHNHTHAPTQQHIELWNLWIIKKICNKMIWCEICFNWMSFDVKFVVLFKLTLKNRWKWWNLHDFITNKGNHKEIVIKTIAKGTTATILLTGKGKWRTLFVCLMIFCVIIFDMQMYGWICSFFSVLAILNYLSPPYLALSHSLHSLTSLRMTQAKNKIVFALSLWCLCACVYYVYCVYLWVYCSSAFEWSKCLRRCWRRRCHRQKTRNDKCVCILLALKFNS